MACKLRIEDFIAPVSQARGPVHSLQEIGNASPLAIGKHGLINIFGALAEGIASVRR